MTVSRLIAACFAAVSIAACGSLAGGVPGATPTPSEIPLPSLPAAEFDVLITDQDRDVAVRVGQKLEVFLRTRPGMTSWSAASADDMAVLSPYPASVTVSGATVFGFKASSPGVAGITAYATPRCAAGEACPMYAILFSVRVTVT